MNSLENTNESLENLEKEVWHLARVELPAMQEQIDGLGSSGSNELATQVNELATAVTNLTTRISALEEYSPAAEQVVTIFDATSSDPAINLGQPAGLRATSRVTHNFNKYRKLRIYMKATASNEHRIIERDMAKFTESDFYYIMPVDLDGFSIYKFQFLANKEYFSFTKSSYYEFVGNPGETVSVTLTQSTANSYGIIRKIEGVLI